MTFKQDTWKHLFHVSPSYEAVIYSFLCFLQGILPYFYDADLSQLTLMVDSLSCAVDFFFPFGYC